MADIEIWKSEYELRQFIHAATRYKIKKGLERVFEHDVMVARENYELFCNQLNDKLNKSQNWKAIEIDVKDRFLPMINQYIDWYENHKDEIDKEFGDNSPYELMFSAIESTRREIYKYFPEKENQMEQPINRVMANNIPTDKQSKEYINDWCHRFFRLAIDKKEIELTRMGEKITDYEYKFIPVDFTNKSHLQQIFDREFKAYCKRNGKEPKQIYLSEFKKDFPEIINHIKNITTDLDIKISCDSILEYINSDKQPTKQKFYEFLDHPKREKLAEHLIDRFKDSTSPELAYMLIALDQHVKGVKTEQKKLYEAMKRDFGFDFTKPAIFDAYRNRKENITYKPQINSIKTIINTILQEL